MCEYCAWFLNLLVKIILFISCRVPALLNFKMVCTRERDEDVRFLKEMSDAWMDAVKMIKHVGKDCIKKFKSNESQPVCERDVVRHLYQADCNSMNMKNFLVTFLVSDPNAKKELMDQIEFKTKHAHCHQNVFNMEQKYLTLKQRYDELITENSQLQHRNSLLQYEFEKLMNYRRIDADVKEASEELATLHDRLQDYKGKYEMIFEENSRLKLKCLESEAGIRNQRQLLEQQTEIVEDLKQQLFKCSQQQDLLKLENGTLHKQLLNEKEHPDFKMDHLEPKERSSELSIDIETGLPTVGDPQENIIYYQQALHQTREENLYLKQELEASERTYRDIYKEQKQKIENLEQQLSECDQKILLLHSEIEKCYAGPQTYKEALSRQCSSEPDLQGHQKTIDQLREMHAQHDVELRRLTQEKAASDHELQKYLKCCADQQHELDILRQENARLNKQLTVLHQKLIPEGFGDHRPQQVGVLSHFEENLLLEPVQLEISGRNSLGLQRLQQQLPTPEILPLNHEESYSFTQQHLLTTKESNEAHAAGDTYVIDSLKKIAQIRSDVEKLESEVDAFFGTREDKPFLHLKEMLIRSVVKLDNVETEGHLVIREQRKDVITYVHMVLDKLVKRVSSEMK